MANPDRPPDLSGVPDALRPLVARMMAHEPAGRPTLDDVTDPCRNLLAEQGIAPTDARRALIDQTASKAALTLTAAVEKRLAEQPDETLASPLNLGPGYEPYRRQAASTAPEQPPARAPEQPRPRARAAARIAEELRLAYSLQRSL